MAWRAREIQHRRDPSLAGSYTPPPNKPTSVHLSPTASSRQPKTIGMPKAPIEYAHEIKQCTFSPRVRNGVLFRAARRWREAGPYPWLDAVDAAPTLTPSVHVAHRRRSLARERSKRHRRDAQVKGVAAHMKQARAWTSVEVTERLAAQPPPPPCASRVPLREAHRVDGVGDASPRWCGLVRRARPPPW